MTKGILSFFRPCNKDVASSSSSAQQCENGSLNGVDKFYDAAANTNEDIIIVNVDYDAQQVTLDANGNRVEDDQENLAHSTFDADNHRVEDDQENLSHPDKPAQISKGSKRKRKSDQWVSGREFKDHWVRDFPFIEPLDEKDEHGFPQKKTRARCTACSWKLGHHVDLQLKLDTIEKHAGKIYEKKMVDGKETNVQRWKTKEECRHLQNVEAYKKELERIKIIKVSPIRSFLQKLADKSLQGKIVQLQAVFHVLKRGRPMTDYPQQKDILELQPIPNFPKSHWSKQSGWMFADCIDEVLKEDLREELRRCDYFAFSLDEATAKDNSSWLCMTVYYVKNFVRCARYVGITRLQSNANAENIYVIVQDSFDTILGLSAVDIAKKLVCIGLDGCSVMQGCRNGLSVKIQTSLAPYALGIHCMAHRMNLAYKIVDTFECVNKFENLIKETYTFFCRSSKRFRKFKKMAAGLTKGNKLLNTVSTRWISLYKPAQRLFQEYPSLVGLMDKLASKQGKEAEKPADLLARLVDLETLLTLAGMLPMLKEMNFLTKLAQKRTMYIAEYVTARKMACIALEFMYPTSPDVPYDKEKFVIWNNLIDIGSNKSILEVDAADKICMKVHSRLVQMYTKKRRIQGRLVRRLPVTIAAFPEIILTVRQNLKKIATTLKAEIAERFPRDELLDAMSIVYPQYWISSKPLEVVQKDFRNKVHTLKDHFSKTVSLGVGNSSLNGAIDGDALLEQSQCFGETMWSQCSELKDPKEFGAITRLWVWLSSSQVLQDRMPEYFRLVILCQTMILGSVEDERTFSIMGYLKNKVRNRLNKSLDICLRAYTCTYSVNDFPYERALALWDSKDRRENQSCVKTQGCSSSLAAVVPQVSDGWSAK